MSTSLAILILGNTVNPFLLFPDSTDVIIRNEITDASITSVFYFAAGSSTLTDAGLQIPIPPGDSEILTFPCRYINRVIFKTDSKGNYRRVAYSPAPYSDTLSISRADKEFGDFFDVILGTRPFVVRSTVPVPLASIFIRNDNSNTESIIGLNPLMTDEMVFLWVDDDTMTIAAVDIEGNISEDITLARDDRDSINIIGVNAFLGETEPVHGNIWIINALNGESIAGLEIYPVFGEPVFLDLSSTPLQLWQGVTVPFTGEIDFIVGIDSHNRTYSITSPDSSTGAFIIDWWHLDFDFDFPERRG